MNEANRGFSLVQLSIALTVVAVAATALLPEGDKSSSIARNESTYQKMAVIQDALEGFKAANGRLPCPADGTKVVANAQFGMEADYKGVCQGWGVDPAANYYDNATAAVMGMLPTKTLGLTDDYALDGYGRRFSYFVTQAATDATSCVQLTEGAVPIKSSSAGVTDSYVMAAIVSHGRNGVGAFFSQGGGRENSTTVADADEIENVDPYTPAATTFDAIVVKKEMTSTFDDLVFTENTCCIGSICEAPPYDGPELFTSQDNVGYSSRLFGRTDDTFSPVGSLNNTASLSVAISRNNTYWFIGKFWELNIYKRSGNNMVFLTQPAPTGHHYSIAASQDGTYVAAATHSNLLVFYRRSGDIFTKLGDPLTMPGVMPNNVTGNADLGYVAASLGAVGEKIMIYKRTGTTTYTHVPNSIVLGDRPPGGDAVDYVDMSEDGQYLAAVVNNNTPSVYIYKRSGDNFTRLAAQPDVTPTLGAVTVKFSHNNTYLVIGTTGGADAPYLWIYKQTAPDVYERIPDPFNAHPESTANGACFSIDNDYMAVGHNTLVAGNRALTIYKRTGDLFSDATVNIVAQYPITTSFDCMFRW